ncbi:MAG: Hsp20/alpha crystallin family protein [Chloroflexota bacterium]|nr:Hsp20/alpha crystallin family protein [Chloroflexota bacterium]
MTGLTRYNPLGEAVSLRQAMDRLFEDSFVSPLSWRTLAGQSWPAIDVHETPEEVVVTAALPGLKPEDVEITMTGQTLSLRGEFKADEKVEQGRSIYQERRFGTFQRQIELPVRVQGERAEAVYENGLLTLHIPKADEVKPRQIQITAGSTSTESTK